MEHSDREKIDFMCRCRQSKPQLEELLRRVYKTQVKALVSTPVTSLPLEIDEDRVQTQLNKLDALVVLIKKNEAAKAKSNENAQKNAERQMIIRIMQQDPDYQMLEDL